MKLRTLPVLALLLAIPAAAAQDCTLGDGPLCDGARSAGLDGPFGTYADLGLVVLGLVGTALVLVLLVAIVRRFRVYRVLRLETTEKVREVEPGHEARFKLEIENGHPILPVDVFVEREKLPEGWQQSAEALVELPAGFRAPQELGETTSIALSSASKGANRAVVEFRVESPPDLTIGETVDFAVRALPVLNGKVRKRRAKKINFTLLVTPVVPKVQIGKVTHEPPRISVGKPVHTTALVTNTGDREARAVAVAFTLNGEEVDRKIVPTLPISGEVQVEFDWTPQPGENKIRVSIAA